MTTIANTTVKRSWAQIVTGKQADSPNADASTQRLKPGARGSLLCHCRGEVLAMLSHYGWLMVYGTVDHPSVQEHEGHVYVSKSDVASDNVLVAGDIVNFYLYVDDKGLGAEWVEQDTTSRFDSDVVEDATTLDHKPVIPFREVALRLSKAFASVDEDDDEEFDFNVTPDVCSEEESDISCDESDDSSVYSWDSTSDLGKPWKAGRASSVDGSTSAGTTSDSEEEISCDAFPAHGKKPLPTFADFILHLPPGMSLPANFRPPPGLTQMTDGLC